jgi:murein DD-endopeptidase MepM/ murein hydrolase activator NlpD
LFGTRSLLGLLTFGAVALGATAVDPATLAYGDLPVATTFGLPVGFPDGDGYYDAQDFGTNYHLGEDWNGQGGGDSDLGDPVAAMADGVVTYAADAGPGWGHVVRVVHHVRRHGESAFVESLYAHLDTMQVQVGDTVTAGAPVGTIGDAHGRYTAHLHFEVRRAPDLPLGPGYSADTSMHLDPSRFIEEMRRGPR